MQSPMQDLIVTIFDLYLMVILIRFFLQLFRADFYNPMSQFVVRVTNPVLIPLRKVIPGLGGMDISSLVFAYAVNLLKFILLFVVLSDVSAPLGRIIILSFADMLSQATNLFFWLIVIRAVISWVNPGLHNPVVAFVYQLTEPLMTPVRRVIPPMGGLDLSPIFLILGLRFASLAINSWIIGPLLHIF